MKKVTKTDSRIRREMGNPHAGADPLQGITEALRAVNEIPILQSAIAELVAENQRLWKAFEKIIDKQAELEGATADIAGLVQYKTEHDKLHRSLDSTRSLHAKTVDASIVAVRSEIATVKSDVLGRVKDELAKFSSKMQSDLQKVYANILGLVKSGSTAPVKDQKLDVDVNIEQGQWEFDVKRNSNGLLDKVIASPRR